MKSYSTVAETNNFIILDAYQKPLGERPTSYQSERQLEDELITTLQQQGYEYRSDITTPEALLLNARHQLETLNDLHFSDTEWDRFCLEYFDRPSDTLEDTTRRIQEDYIYDFKFDDGTLHNIYLVDKRQLLRNKVQVIRQFEQSGTHDNRYDVTILVNGLPLVQVELKRRGIAIREAFNQIHRYSKESFNSDSSLYRYLQLFVISNGTDTRYFANTLKREKTYYGFTMEWAQKDNKPLKDLIDFTATFFQKNSLLHVLFTYCVLDTTNTLFVLRPYQIAATERILWKIRSSHEAGRWSRPEGGGYIWHTTGSGKTLTSFKTAQLATQIEFVDKVFFVVDRKDLDDQTLKEYRKYSEESVTGSASTVGLRNNIERNDGKIIVTTIQKLNNFLKSEQNHPIYSKEVVFIFDECHRSQFGEAQSNLRRKFKKYYQFGFTGTPIFPENALGEKTTESVFGSQLHTYVITDAIRDGKVLKFSVVYNDTRPKFKQIEQTSEDDEVRVRAERDYNRILHPDRIEQISRYILRNFRYKTKRTEGSKRGFNALFAVGSVEAAKLYYETLQRLQAESDEPVIKRHPLRIATIFSYAANEEQHAKGEIKDEGMNPGAMDQSSKEFLERVIQDYSETFGISNLGVDSKGFENYYTSVSAAVKEGKVDLLIVVGMFLTGFDAPGLNTLFVDKNLSYHGLIQSYSRTNRIFDSTKDAGNIVTFRDLEQATNDAITLFGQNDNKGLLIEQGYESYINGFVDPITGKVQRGYKAIVSDLLNVFSDPHEITNQGETRKKEFVLLFGEYLVVDSMLRNFDEYIQLKEYKLLDPKDTEAVESFKEKFFVTDERIGSFDEIDVLMPRTDQDYRSVYNDLRNEFRPQKPSPRPPKHDDEKEGDEPIDWSDVVFEVELLKSQEIDLDYILSLILEWHKEHEDKSGLVEDVRRIIRSSNDNRAKERLILDYIEVTDLDSLDGPADIIESFYHYAQARLEQEMERLIAEEGLKPVQAQRYIRKSLKLGRAPEEGTDLREILPKMSPLDSRYLPKKQQVYDRISHFVAQYCNI